MTMRRLKNCCRMFIDDPSYVPQIVLDHFPLNVPDNKQFYNNNMMEHYRFTILRDPVDQIISKCLNMLRNIERPALLKYISPTPGFCMEIVEIQIGSHLLAKDPVWCPWKQVAFP